LKNNILDYYYDHKTYLLTQEWSLKNIIENDESAQKALLKAIGDAHSRKVSVHVT